MNETAGISQLPKHKMQCRSTNNAIELQLLINCDML